ncbi:MAG TPA: transcriptional repressor [Micrococcales bacterium]|uniref:Transcriptional repressor n=1 Tax=Miniimonas arenae TaxID=676201 RepID=A0A5C5BFJ1_9MICO|nr:MULTISPECIES: transcriptional repressor [Miniimonas]TNU76599.1 transcriptional repressor [Miniimonas arenae]HCX84735.1 transcriptional repressor [Micrococcales bacterium]
MPRTTRQRTAVADLLDGVPDFHSAQDLHRMLHDRGERVALATVYRTLQVLTDLGEVDSVRGPDGELRYRRCEAEAHHHHLVCRSCGTTVELDAAAVEAWAGGIARAHGFTDVEHTVELFGLCARCGSRSADAR